MDHAENRPRTRIEFWLDVAGRALIVALAAVWLLLPPSGGVRPPAAPSAAAGR